MISSTPTWLTKLERRFGVFAIPHLAKVMVGVQLFGVIAILINPESIQRLVLWPPFVMEGEVWRLFTFMSVPLYQITGLFSMIFLYFYLQILYMIVSALEETWGGFKTTLYILIAWLLSITFSFVAVFYFGQFYPLKGMLDIGISLFLAVAVLAPNAEVALFFVLPVKFRFLAILAGAWVAFRLVTGDGFEKVYVAMVYANYLLFFGSYHLDQLKQMQRRKKFRDQWK